MFTYYHNRGSDTEQRVIAFSRNVRVYYTKDTAREQTFFVTINIHGTFLKFFFSVLLVHGQVFFAYSYYDESAVSGAFSRPFSSSNELATDSAVFPYESLTNTRLSFVKTARKRQPRYGEKGWKCYTTLRPIVSSCRFHVARAVARFFCCEYTDHAISFVFTPSRRIATRCVSSVRRPYRIFGFNSPCVILFILFLKNENVLIPAN